MKKIKKTKQVEPGFDCRRDPVLKALAQEEFAAMLYEHGPLVIHQCVESCMTLVATGTAVVHGYLVRVAPPTSVDEAGARLIDLAQFWRITRSHLVLGTPDPDNRVMSVEVPMDGDFQKRAEGTMHLLKERPELMRHNPDLVVRMPNDP